MKNDTVKLIQNHRSIRKYIDKPIEDEILQELMQSAQWASSSHNVQAYNVVVVKDKQRKKMFADLCGGQKWIENCPVFLVLSADFYRLKKASEMNTAPCEIDEIENLLVGTVDTALVAQNILLSAESYGLGGVIIGGIRNNISKVVELLELPKYTVPIVGICLGYPDEEQIPGQKPRLPQRVVVFEETYKKELIEDGLVEYEKISAEYYTRRTQGKRTDGWTKQMAEYLSKPRRPELKGLIMEQGFKIK